MTHSDTAAETVEMRRKRLFFRAQYRGMKELDMACGHFAEQYLAGFDARQLDEFEAILEVQDADLYDWLVKGRPVPPEMDGEVMRMFLAFDLAEHL